MKGNDIMKANTVCFSGHRPEKFPSSDENSDIIIRIKKDIYREIKKSIDQGFTTFITGCARGVDIWAALMVIEQKHKNDNIKLISAIPYKEHGKSFKGKDKFLINNILLNSDEIIYVSESYSRDCMRLRNQFMVDNSSKLIAVVSDYRSGTGQTIRYANKQGLDTIIIDINKALKTL